MEGYTKYKMKKKTIGKMVDGEMKNAGVEKIVDMRGRVPQLRGWSLKSDLNGRFNAARQDQESDQRSRVSDKWDTYVGSIRKYRTL